MDDKIILFVGFMGDIWNILPNSLPLYEWLSKYSNCNQSYCTTNCKVTKYEWLQSPVKSPYKICSLNLGENPISDEQSYKVMVNKSDCIFSYVCSMVAIFKIYNPKVHDLLHASEMK